ncbi:MAG TPA: hypothetical protein VFH56_06555 [Acidimicrobiales bacterium]|nr:hypothetical protein [Acidimicrobiales bacterium]
MRSRLRAWLVALIADGVVEAHRRQELHAQINMDGQDLIIRAIRHRNRRRGVA